MRPYLENFVQLWTPQYNREMEILEKVQCMTTKIIEWLRLEGIFKII